MDPSTFSLKERIASATSAAECEAIQQDLETLTKYASVQRANFKDKEREDALNFKGRGALPCSFCNSTLDPENELFCDTCEGCNELACKECFSTCKECEKVLCLNNCGMQFCESCDNHVCSDCASDCYRCGEATCAECVFLVGPPEWKCCEGCRDEWVEDGWRKY